MEFLAIGICFAAVAIFMCFIVFFLEWRELRHRNEVTELKNMIIVLNSSIPNQFEIFSKKFSEIEQNFYELKDYAYKTDKATEELIKEKQSKLGASNSPPQGVETYEDL